MWTPIYEGMPDLIQKKISKSIHEMADNFERNHKGITVVVETYPDTILYKKYKYVLQHGLGPDVILVHNLMLGSLVKEKLLLEIPEKKVSTG